MKPLVEFHPDIMEEPFRRQVRSIARMYGWTMQYHTHNSKFSDGGFPDEVYVHPLYNRVLFVEFKRQKGAIKPKQVEWLSWASRRSCVVAGWNANRFSRSSSFMLRLSDSRI